MCAVEVRNCPQEKPQKKKTGAAANPIAAPSPRQKKMKKYKNEKKGPPSDSSPGLWKPNTCRATTAPLEYTILVTGPAP